MNASWPRRRVLTFLGSIGASAVFARAFISRAEGEIEATAEMIRQAEWVAGVSYDDSERELMLEGVNDLLESFRTIRAVELDNAVPPALRFDPPGSQPGRPNRRGTARSAVTGSVAKPDDEERIAFASIGQQGRWLREKAISSEELTRIYLDRIARFDPRLRCVITLLEDRALEQARQADRELTAGRDRGALHGIPWGAKDLLAVPGAPTTWGATPFREQIRAETATVVERLDEAGAVLVAKLTLGALAWGDEWFEARTNNPWNLEQGSSGSSAGSASAVAAGLVGFALGSETWGSIVSPCTRCGASGLRPTFGRVSRYGAMALSWTMDKIGPIARSADDCALVFDAIRGEDGRDRTVADGPFRWPQGTDPRLLKVGYVQALFEEDRAEGIGDPATAERMKQWQANDRAALEALREAGLQLEPIALPDEIPVGALSFILTAEAATAFDELTRSGRDDELRRQVARAWPNVFRQGQLIPAVEYLRANRLRTLLVESLNRRISELDVFVTPSFGGDVLLMTNLTGHPAAVVPNGLAAGTPTSLSFVGKLHGDAELLAVAHAYQGATEHHLARPPLAADAQGD